MKKSTRESGAISGLARKKTVGIKGGLGCLLISVPFFLAEAAVTYFVGARPLIKIIRASSWNPTPCVVTASTVASSSDGDTFRPEIHYSYVVDDKRYEGTRYSFAVGYSSGRSSKQAVVDENPVGKNTTCYVNPGEPSESILYRGFTWDMLWGLFGVPFLLVGLAGPTVLLSRFIKKQRRRENLNQTVPWPTFSSTNSMEINTTLGGAPLRSSQSVTAYSVGNVVSTQPSFGRVVLEPTMSPAKRLIVLVVIAVFWNGIVSVFVGLLINEWGKGNEQWFLGLFLTPFVLIGLVLIYGVAHGFLTLFNPRPRLTINSRQLHLGQSYDLDWEFSGAIRRIRQLRIFLEGREEATYRRGTTTTTDKHVFATIQIADKSSADPGRAVIEIPKNTMHSFKSGNNRIVWEIHVKGDISFWSDVDESFEVELLPAMSTGISVNE